MSERRDDMNEHRDDMRDLWNKEDFDKLSIKVPKVIGEIKVCGFLHIAVMDDQDFIRPTKEQIKNLHNMLCIDVVMFDEESED